MLVRIWHSMVEMKVSIEEVLDRVSTHAGREDPGLKPKIYYVIASLQR